MTRPSEVTRDRIMKAAERLFAEKGYDGTSIRAIVAKARVNQAAINYHFDGKDGLYREVLRAAFRSMTENQLAHAQDVKTLSRESALDEFIRRQLHPLLARDESSRHMRIFNWETVRPTPVFRSLVAEEASPPAGLNATVPRLIGLLPPASATKSMEPVGDPWPGAAVDTVAVNCTAWP